jgi:hypothetical protein
MAPGMLLPVFAGTKNGATNDASAKIRLLLQRWVWLPSMSGHVMSACAAFAQYEPRHRACLLGITPPPSGKNAPIMRAQHIHLPPSNVRALPNQISASPCFSVQLLPTGPVEGWSIIPEKEGRAVFQPKQPWGRQAASRCAFFCSKVAQLAIRRANCLIFAAWHGMISSFPECP